MPVAEAAVILTPVLDWLDLVGVAVFALSGALIAARERQTFVTMGFFALVTGVGGGTVRDLLIDAPVFWVRHPWYAAVCIAMAAIVWNTPTRWWQGKLFDYADGVGLAAYSVLGAAKAMSYGLPPVSATIMGIITGTVGGTIRDVIAGRPSILMRPELYVTAAALSATLCSFGMWLDRLGVRRSGRGTAAKRGNPLQSRSASLPRTRNGQRPRDGDRRGGGRRSDRAGERRNLLRRRTGGNR